MTLGREDLLSRKMKKKTKWISSGYVSKSKNGAHIIIMIPEWDGTKQYYIADLNEVLEVLTDRRDYTKILTVKSE